MEIASLVQLAARHRRILWTLVIALTVFLGAGIGRIRLETGVIDWLPRNHPNVMAFHRVLDSLEGVVNQELLWLELDAEKARKLGVRSINDHGSLLAQDELVSYLRRRIPQIRGVFGVLPWIKMLRHIQTGGQSATPELPGSALETDLLWTALKTVAGDLVNSLVSSENDGTVLSLIIEASPFSTEARKVGLALDKALASYRNDPSVQNDIFRHEYLHSSGLASGTAIIDRSLRRDLLLLTPIAALFLATVLRLVLGNWRVLFLVLGVLVVGTLWTLGSMGWVGTPLNVITVSLVPLLLGCGIDYAILISLESLDRRVDGASPDETLRGISRSAALAIVLTTITTIAGLFTLCFSDSPGIVALGFHAALGMAGLALLATLVLPAMIVRIPARKRSRFGPIIAPLAGSFARNRKVVLIVYVIATGAALTLIRKPVFLLDVIQGNYPEDAPITRSVERMREKTGGTFPELVIASGDMASPAALERLDRIKDRISASSILGDRFQAVGLTDLLGLHALLQERNLLEIGAALARLGGDVRRAAPETGEGIRAAVGDLLADPVWAPLASMFIDDRLSVATILLLGGDAGDDVEAVGATWEELERVVADTTSVPGPIEVSFLGYRTMAYLFITYSLSWIRITAAVSLLVVLALASYFLRERRAVMAVALLLVTSGVLWFGLLQLVGIYISLFLLFPLVFAMCVGSDYALHILCRLRADRLASPEGALEPYSRSRSAWSTTGRAIAFAAFTDGGVFLIYSFTHLVSASQVMLAVSLAVVSYFACTVVLVPALVSPASPTAEGPPVIPADGGEGE